MPPNMQEALPNVTANIIFIIVFVKCPCFLVSLTLDHLDSRLLGGVYKALWQNLGVKLKKQMSGKKKTTNVWDFPGSTVIKTLHFHCRGSRFDPWSRN